MGPSILLTCISEVCCFVLGILSDMPAVQAFSIYAGVALLIDFLLQITCFISLLSLDERRRRANRMDVCCCVHLSKNGNNPSDAQQNGDRLQAFFHNKYCTFLMKRKVRYGVIVLFFGWLCLSISVIPKLQLGLDKELSMPKDSFVSKYFLYLQENLSVGPPVYFILTGNLNFSNMDVQNAICSESYLCDSDSLVAQIYSETITSNISYITQPIYSWIDDYLAWSTVKTCCKRDQMNELCLSGGNLLDVSNFNGRCNDF